METTESNSNHQNEDYVFFHTSDVSEKSENNDSIWTEENKSESSEPDNSWDWNFVETTAIDENLVIGNKQWLIASDTTLKEFSSKARDDIFDKVDIVFDKLREKFPVDNTSSESDKENPFANGNNPFGEGEFTPPPGYGNSDSSSNGNPFGSVEEVNNLFSDGETTGESEESSFDVSSFMFGDNLSFMNGNEASSGSGGTASSSPDESLRMVYDTITRFTSDTTYPGFTTGNNTPFKTSDDLLTLFRNDMFTNNSGNSFEQLIGEESSMNSDEKIAENLEIIKAALDGLLHFNGTENVFNTPEGEIPLGNGNIDSGNDNAVIGNANRDYGDINATIGNGNWNWDGTTKNSTVGNGNWHLDFSDNNNTLGNGNWHWEDSDNNSTLGNGNWNFGDNNSTIGNGNFNFGNNNTVIGNGNWVYTDNSIVIGNGNWSVVIDKSEAAAEEFLEDFNATMDYGAGVKSATDNLIDGMLGKMAGMLSGLTDDLGESAMNTYKAQFLSI